MDRKEPRLVPLLIMVVLALGTPAVRATRNTCFRLWVDSLDCCRDAYGSGPRVFDHLLGCQTECLSRWELGGDQGARGPDNRDTCRNLWQ